MDKDLRKYFTHPKVLQIFQRYSTYNGSHPGKAPGTMNLIPSVEYGLGAWGVKGGIYAITSALEKLARSRSTRDSIFAAEGRIRGEGCLW